MFKSWFSRCQRLVGDECNGHEADAPGLLHHYALSFSPLLNSDKQAFPNIRNLIISHEVYLKELKDELEVRGRKGDEKRGTR